MKSTRNLLGVERGRSFAVGSGEDWFCRAVNNLHVLHIYY
jgi:hypothetical protein